MASKQVDEREQAGEVLREMESQYKSIFESTSDAVLIFGLDGRIVEANPAACRMYGYSCEELIGLSEKDIVHPDYHHLFEDYAKQVKTSGHFSAQSVDLRKDGSPINVEVHGASFRYRGKPHLLAVVHDITERMQSQGILERRVEERTREIERRQQVAEGLREILAVLNTDRPLDEILDYIVAQARHLLSSDACVLYRLDQDEQTITIEASSGLPEEFLAVKRLPLYAATALGRREVDEAVLSRKPFAIPNVAEVPTPADEDDSNLSPELRAWRMASAKHYRAFLTVPLIIKDKVYGSLGFHYSQPRPFSEEEIDLGVSLGNQAALAIENARLHQAEQDRQRELQILLDVAAAASSSLELDQMLSAVLDRLVTLVRASRAGVMLLNRESGGLEPRMLRPQRSIAPDDLVEMSRVCQRVIASGKPLYVPVDPTLGHSEPGALLPLLVRGQAVGVLVIIGPQGSAFSKRHLALFESIADQLGVAVENARLYARVEQAAIAAERSRLARDLHDSVTQSLYSMTLFAEAARRLSAGKEEGAVEEYLSQLCETSQQALKEMRLLVYQLRPSGLEKEGLIGALRQRLDAVERRAGIEVRLSSLAEEPLDLPPELEDGLYRIAQEALNNSLKHANADAVTVQIQIKGDLLIMEITDNGRGFDLTAVADTGGIGLASMQERAEKLSGNLRIVSTPGKGTKVQVQVKVR